MKSKFLFPILLLFIFSCSDEPFFIEENEALKSNAESIELGEFDDQLPGTANDIVAGSGDFDINWCINKCDRERRDCFERASDDKEHRLLDCESIRIERVEVVDVYCTENVIVGYRTIITPEGEEIEVPIYDEVEVVCGEKEVNIFTEDEELLQQYEACREQALAEFVDAVDDCDVKRFECLVKCEKPNTGEGDDNDDDNDDDEGEDDGDDGDDNDGEEGGGEGGEDEGEPIDPN